MKHLKLFTFSAIMIGLLLSGGDLFSKVTRVYVIVKPGSFEGKCPKTFEFTGKITSDSRGIVKYKWIRSDNASAPEKTISFRSPGTQIVKTTWTLGGPGRNYNGWQAIRILSPNRMTSNRAAFTLKCGVYCDIHFKSLSKTSGYPGDTFKMYGKWGPTQGTKTPCINKGTANKLIVLSWSNTVLNVKIPAGLAPGKYRVGVYCKFPITGPTGGSTWKDFTIKSRVVKPLKPVQTLKPVRVRPGVLTRNCPDPAAHEIRFQIVSRTSQFSGRIRITGIVKNIGAKAFQSGPNQAKAYLYELPAGVPPSSATGGRIIAQREIRNLAPGATINLTYERNWNSSSPAEGEFPNSYRLLISYDPDIYMDDNKNNDDCNQNNNKKDRSGTEINDMLR